MPNLDQVIDAAATVMRCRGALKSCEEEMKRQFDARRVHQDNLTAAEKSLFAAMEVKKGGAVAKKKGKR